MNRMTVSISTCYAFELLSGNSEPSTMRQQLDANVICPTGQ